MYQTLSDRLRIVELPRRGTFGVKWHAKIEGVLIAGGRERDSTVEHAMRRLTAAGVTVDTPTWDIKAMLEKTGLV